MPGKSTKATVILNQGVSNGESIGDAYGVFEVPGDFNTDRYFKSGEWIFFDNLESKDVLSFKLETGTCNYEGPFRK
jgi:hypothetical protein